MWNMWPPQSRSSVLPLSRSERNQRYRKSRRCLSFSFLIFAKYKVLKRRLCAEREKGHKEGARGAGGPRAARENHTPMSDVDLCGVWGSGRRTLGLATTTSTTVPSTRCSDRGGRGDRARTHIYPGGVGALISLCESCTLPHTPKYTRYMYNDDPLRQRRPHTRTSQVTKVTHTQTLLHSKAGRAGRISLRGGRRRALTQWGRSRLASAA